MSLPVHLASRAHQDIEESYEWWTKNRSAEQAQRWRDLCVRTIDSLSNKNTRSSWATENSALPIPARQVTFGLGRRPTHRVVFTIRPDMILVLRVQSLSQRPLSPDDI
jgi:plasmid stabilization system protein ParE